MREAAAPALPAPEKAEHPKEPLKEQSQQKEETKQCPCFTPSSTKSENESYSKGALQQTMIKTATTTKTKLFLLSLNDFPDGDAERVHVGGRAPRLVQQQLGRHVEGRSKTSAAACEEKNKDRLFSKRRYILFSLPTLLAGHSLANLCEAEIRQHHTPEKKERGEKVFSNFCLHATHQLCETRQFSGLRSRCTTGGFLTQLCERTTKTLFFSFSSDLAVEPAESAGNVARKAHLARKRKRLRRNKIQLNKKRKNEIFFL